MFNNVEVPWWIVLWAFINLAGSLGNWYVSAMLNRRRLTSTVRFQEPRYDVARNKLLKMWAVNYFPNNGEATIAEVLKSTGLNVIFSASDVAKILEAEGYRYCPLCEIWVPLDEYDPPTGKCTFCAIMTH